MKQLIDKVPLLVCSLIILFTRESKIEPVMAILAAVSVSSLSSLLERGKTAAALQIFFIILCGMHPVFFFSAPIVMYDVFEKKDHYIAALAGGVLMLKSFSFEAAEILYILGLVFAAAILASRTSELEKVMKKLIVTRDTSAEANLTLKEKNRRLIEHQDNEIRYATLKERNRIAREIHDNVGHLLSRSILQAGALGYVKDEKIRKEGLDSLSETLNNAMTSIRRSVHDIHDDSIDLKQSLEEILKPLEEKSINVYREIDCPMDMSNNEKLCIIGVAKEAVSNIIKHSSCDRVALTFIDHPGFRQLKITDNGKCSREIRHTGIGLYNMRQRVEDLGGIITFNSGEKGFEVFISIKKERKIT